MQATDSADAAEAGVDEPTTVTVHLRAAPSTAAARRQQSVLEQLRSLETDGVVPELVIQRWGAQVSVPVFEDDSDDATAVALYDEFAAAAEDSGVRLAPFFETREAVGGILSSGPPTERIVVFPVVCVTIRREGDLTGLYPCWKDGVHQSVEDCLDGLSTGADVENL